MEDYDVFTEMQNLKSKKVIMAVEDDENFIATNLLNSKFELIPIRFSYNLSSFSNHYIEKTKKLFTYYYENHNPYNNEILRLKKHFIHYQRFPFIAYVPLKKEYFELIKMLRELKIECVNDRQLFLNKINNDKKLILIDSDETIKRSDGSVSERTKNAVSKNQQIGNIIVICTARPRYQTIEVMDEVGANKIVISSNGAEIYDVANKKIIKSVFINKNEIFKFIEYAYLKDIRLILTARDYDYVTKEIRNPKQILLKKDDYLNQIKDIDIKQCMFIDKKETEIYNLKKIVSESENVDIVDEIRENDPYEEKWFSVVNSNTSKGRALLELADFLEIPIKNTIAIGNDKNDISMFETCGFSVAVDNASDFIKDKVNYVTYSNDKDGVGIFLEKIVSKD